MKIQIKKLSKEAKIPTSNWGDAGYDLYSVENYTLCPLERKLFKTDICISIPQGFYGRITDRSGKALKDGLHTLAGTIDSGYRGEIGVVLVNLNCYDRIYGEIPIDCNSFGEISVCKNNVQIKKGDKIAQIIFEEYKEIEFVETSELDQTIRGESGYGSTGR